MSGPYISEGELDLSRRQFIGLFGTVCVVGALGIFGGAKIYSEADRRITDDTQKEYFKLLENDPKVFGLYQQLRNHFAQYFESPPKETPNRNETLLNVSYKNAVISAYLDSNVSGDYVTNVTVNGGIDRTLKETLVSEYERNGFQSEVLHDKTTRLYRIVPSLIMDIDIRLPKIGNSFSVASRTLEALTFHTDDILRIY